MSRTSRRSGEDSSIPTADSARFRLSTASRRALGVAGLAGAAALVAATFLPVIRIEVDGRARPALDQTGWDLHGPALLLLAAVAVPLLVLALRGAPIAPLALAFAGLGALAIAVFADAPDVGDTGAVGTRLLEGTSVAGPGIYLETLGAILLVFAGGVIALAREE